LNEFQFLALAFHDLRVNDHLDEAEDNIPRIKGVKQEMPSCSSSLMVK